MSSSENEKSSLDQGDISSDAVRDDKSSTGENEAEDEEADEFEDAGQAAADFWQRSKKSFFEFGYISDETYEDEYEEEEEEEEEVARPTDLQGFALAPIKSELSGFEFSALGVEDRLEMIDKLKDLYDEARVQMVKSKFLHKKYIDAMRNSSSFSSALDKFDEVTIFEDDRYQTTLENYSLTRDDIESRRDSLTSGLQFLNEDYTSAESDFDVIFKNLASREQAVAKKIKPLKLSKEAWAEMVDEMLELQWRKVQDIARIRLTYIRLSDALEKYTGRMRRFDNLGPGFSIVDYEYLMKRKDVYSEKRDEQRQHIKWLEEKNLTCAGVIRHVDEESDLYNEKVKEESDRLETLKAENRIERAKAVELVRIRALIFKNIMKLKDEIGLLDRPYLLKKMASDLKEVARLKRRSEIMRSKMYSDQTRVSEKR